MIVERKTKSQRIWDLFAELEDGTSSTDSLIHRTVDAWNYANPGNQIGYGRVVDALAQGVKEGWPAPPIDS